MSNHLLPNENLNDPFDGYDFLDDVEVKPKRTRKRATTALPECVGPVYSHFAFCVKWVEKRCNDIQRKYPDIEGLKDDIRSRLYGYMPNILKNFKGPEGVGSPHWQAWVINCLKLKARHFLMLKMEELTRERKRAKTIRVIDGEKLLKALDKKVCPETSARIRSIQVEDILSKLPEYDAYLLRYVYMEGHTLAEMANTLGVTYRYQVKREVDAALARTRLAIRDLFAD